jgi:hypothetical protein
MGKDMLVLGPIVLWIGVNPNTLLKKDAFSSANGLLKLLKCHNISNIDVEYCESLYRRLVAKGPHLFQSVSDYKLTKDIVGPLTTALGLSIASFDSPGREGMLSLYLAEGGESEDILAITTCHILFPKENNSKYRHKFNSMLCKNIILMGNGVFEDLLLSIKNELGNYNKKN